MSILERTVLPVATEEDAERTCSTLGPLLEEVDGVVAVHVIEKAGGAPDKAPMEKREADAEAIFDVVEDRLGDRVPVETELVYGTDVVDALFEIAEAVDASAIAFRAREQGRLTRLLSGDTSTRLVTEATVPVVALPRED